MDAYVDFLAVSLAGMDAAKADRLKRIQKDIRVPFSFTPTADLSKIKNLHVVPGRLGVDDGGRKAEDR